MFKVKEIYEELKEKYPTRPFLSQYQGAFWSEYITNYTYYDRLFIRKYTDFSYYNNSEDLEEVATDFFNQVGDFLLANNKRYSELYRIYQLTDATNPLLTNYKVSDTTTKNDTSSISETIGSRNDTSSNTFGSRSDTSENKVAGFNSDSYQKSNQNTLSKGQEIDSSSFSKGSQSNTQSTTSSGSTTKTKSGFFNKSADNLVNDHLQVWTDYEFFTHIFADISRELFIIE